MRIDRGSKNNTVGFLFKTRSKKTQNNTMLVVGVIVLVVLGLAVYYFMSSRNGEGYVDSNPFTGLEVTTKKEVDKLDKDTNVVVIFHKMQGCGHCKTFVPIWKNLTDNCNKINKGKPIDAMYNPLKNKVKKNNKKLFCRCVDMMDSLSDDVSGFPEIRVYKPDRYVSFSGNRENEKELVDFISSNM